LAILAISIVATGVWWGKKYLQNRGHASRQVVPQLQEAIQENEKKPLPKVEEPERPPLTGSKSQLVVEPQPAEPVKKITLERKGKKASNTRKR
jgi:hypothetical protein